MQQGLGIDHTPVAKAWREYGVSSWREGTFRLSTDPQLVAKVVEVWFGIVERQALHRADVASVKELNARIRAFVIGWNDRCHPFVWTKASTGILKKSNRSTTSETGH